MPRALRLARALSAVPRSVRLRFALLRRVRADAGRSARPLHLEETHPQTRSKPMTRALRLLALPNSLALLVLVTTSCAPLAPAVGEVSSPRAVGTPPERAPDPPPIRPAESFPPPAREVLLYPYNLPSYGNDVDAELARSAKSQDDTSRSH
jgi:hypothetical protein